MYNACTGIKKDIGTAVHVHVYLGQLAVWKMKQSAFLWWSANIYVQIVVKNLLWDITVDVLLKVKPGAI